MVKLILAMALVTIPAQEPPDVTVGIRPEAIRVGGRGVMTVRIVTSREPVEWVEFLPNRGVEVEDVSERESTLITPGGSVGYVLEVEFRLIGIDPGNHRLPPVTVYWEGVAYETEAPILSVSQAPLEWGVPQRRPREGAYAEDRTRAQRDEGVLHEGVPPQEGELLGVIPNPNPTGQGGMLFPGAPGYGSGAYWSSFPGQYPQALPSNPWGYPLSGMGIPGIPGAYPGLAYPPNPYYPGGFPANPGMTGNPGAWGGIPNDSTGSNSGPMGGGYPYGVAGGGYPYGMMGTAWGWPPSKSGGWSATARSDPWWPELIPELLSYHSIQRGPEGLLTLSTGVTPDVVYVGQQVTYVATVSLAPGALLSLGGDPEYLPPNPEGFWAVDLPELSSGTPVAAQGEVLQSYTFKRTLFPLESGAKFIPPSQIVAFDPAGRPGAVGAAVPTVMVESDPLPVTVLPIPLQDAPPGYGGAVGRFRMEAFLTPQQVAVGETAVLTVRILGAGNVQGLPTPEIGHFPEVEMAPFSDWALPEVQDGVIGGVKTFNWLLVPLTAGLVRLGPILYPYFDPYLGGFGMAEAPELELTVTELPSSSAGRGQAPGGGVGYTPGAGQASTEPPRFEGDGSVEVGGEVDGVVFPSGVPVDSEAGTRQDASPLRGLSTLESGNPSADVEAWKSHVILNPRDPEGWYNLGVAFAATPSDEGWSTWAWLTASRLAPRDEGIGSILAERGVESRRRHPLLLPLSPIESLLLTSVLFVLGGALALSPTLFRRWAGRKDHAARSVERSGLPDVRSLGARWGVLLWMCAVALAISPWALVRFGPDRGVVVGGEATVRAEPFLGSSSTTRWRAGTPVLLIVGDRHGWARAQEEGGVEGWVEASAIAPIPAY